MTCGCSSRPRRSGTTGGVGEDAPVAGRTAGHWAALALVVLAVLLPFGTRGGWWDVWPGWAVYANGVPTILARPVPSPDRPAAPGDGAAGSLASVPEWWDVSYRFNVGAAGLNELGVPVPQDSRVRVGILIAEEARLRAAGEMVPSDGVTVTLQRAPGRFGFAHPPSTYHGPAQIAALADAFLLNARPRALSLPGG